MYRFRTIFARSQPLLRYTAALATTIALAGSLDVIRADADNSVHAGRLRQQPIASHLSSQLFRQDAPVISKVVLGDLSGLIILLVIGGTLVAIPLFFGGLVVIGEREVGVVVKKFTMSGKGLSPDRLIALNGEAGLQADTLAPGWHWGYWPWQYGVKKEQVVVVPQSEIALIVAADGSSIPSERILGTIVNCDNFQDARKFLTQGGEKGRQLGFLTAGTYRINTALFKVIMAANAEQHEMSPAQLRYIR